MTVERNLITKEFKRYIWPLCKVHGFSKINGRILWRYRDGIVDVIQLQGSYYNGVASMPHEFFINLGVFIVPLDLDVRHEREKAIPSEPDCHLRGSILGRDTSGHRITGGAWQIQQDGSNLESVFLRLQKAIETEALSWFRQFEGLPEILSYLVNGGADNELGSGRIGSAHRTFMAARLAQHLGDAPSAEACFDAYLRWYDQYPEWVRGEQYELALEGLAEARALLASVPRN